LSQKSVETTLLHKSSDGQSIPLFQLGSAYGLCARDSKHGVNVHDGAANLGLYNLMIEVTRHEALADELYTMHLCLGAATQV
jgi:hypothetical protein